MKHRAVCAGIDPGVTGGIAVLDIETGELVNGIRTPVLPVPGKKHYDIQGMKEVLLGHAYDLRLVAIEKVGTLPRDGRVGAFSFGCGYGIWLGLMTGMSIPFIEVLPQRWQAKMLAGYPKGPKTKASAMRVAKNLFPSINVRVKADSGIADAALIGEFGRRVHIGQ